MFYLDERPVTIKELFLYEIQPYYEYYLYLAALFFITVSLIFLILASYDGQIFRFILLSLITFIGYSFNNLYPPMLSPGDNSLYMPQVFSLIVEQNLDVNEYPVENYPIALVENNKFNYFPYGTVLVNYPLTLITKHFTNCSSEEMSKVYGRLYCGAKIAAINAKILASMSVGFMFLTLLAITNQFSTSLFLSLVFAFASPNFSTHYSTLWSHNISTFLITSTLFLITKSSSSTYLAAIPLFLAYVTRPSMSVSVAILSVYYIFSNRKNKTSIMKYIILLSLVGFIFLAINIFSYNDILPPYYFSNRLNFANWREAILGIFISPNRGVFIFFPIALFSFFGIYLAFKNHITKSSNLSESNNKLLFTSLSLAVLMHSLTYSLFPHWWMGYSYGPRMFAEIIPYLIILLIQPIEYIRNIITMKYVFAICLIFSVYVQLVGVFSIDAGLWNANPVSVDQNSSRIWDWKDMQMFRWLKVQK